MAQYHSEVQQKTSHLKWGNLRIGFIKESLQESGQGIQKPQGTVTVPRN